MLLVKRLQPPSSPLRSSCVVGWLRFTVCQIPHAQMLAYERLQQRIDFFASWAVLPWNSDAVDKFVHLRRKGVRIGSMDLKIACITLAHGGTWLTGNSVEYTKVPDLSCENW